MGKSKPAKPDPAPTPSVKIKRPKKRSAVPSVAAVPEKPITRQWKSQLARIAAGLCKFCGKPRENAELNANANANVETDQEDRIIRGTGQTCRECAEKRNEGERRRWREKNSNKNGKGT